MRRSRRNTRYARILASLRRSGSRLFAATLLFTFLVGSIVARDVVLMQQVQVHRALAELEVVRESAVDGHHRKVSRPSGISKRAAWSPTDPPDDDDETDEDSDTFASHLPRVVLPGAAPSSGPAVVELLAAAPSRGRVVIAHRAASRAHSVRGPPRAGRLGR